MKTYKVLIQLKGRSPQWVTVDARDQYHMKQMIHAIYGSCSITNYNVI